MDQQKQKRENGGYLFKNADKRSDKQPDFRGKMNVAGQDWLISGWSRIKDGEDMISISLTDPASLPQRDAKTDAKTAVSSPRPSANGAVAGKPAISSSLPTPATHPATNLAVGSRAAPATKSFQPQAGASTPAAGYEDMEDLDSLFNGLED